MSGWDGVMIVRVVGYVVGRSVGRWFLVVFGVCVIVFQPSFAVAIESRREGRSGRWGR